MFVADDVTAEAIRRAYHEDGEMCAAIELRRHFPGITDNEKAWLCVRSTLTWAPPASAPSSPR